MSTGADPSGLLTPSAPSPAGCTSGGLGAQDATESDRGRRVSLSLESIPRDVPGARCQCKIRLRHRRLVTLTSPPMVAQPRQPCSPRFKLLALRWALPLAAQRYSQAPLAALQARALPSAPRMLYANPKPKQTWLRHRRLLTLTSPPVVAQPRQPCSPRFKLPARRWALPLAAQRLCT